MKKITLIDTYNNYDYDAVKDFCEINEMETPQENSEDDFAMRRNLLEMDVEDFWANVKHGQNLDACVVMGSVGTWRGRFDIEPKVFKTLYDAFNACAHDAYDIIVEQDHSTFIFKAMHHDGTNVFYARLLNGKGYDAWHKNEWGANIDLSRRVYHETLKEYVF